MVGILTLLLIVGLFLWFIWYLFFRSVLWVAEPLIDYFEGREAERFSIDDIDKDEFDDNDLENIPKNKVKIAIRDFDKPIHLSRSFLQKAQKEPQKINNTNLWIYRNYIFSSKPTKEKIMETFQEKG